MNQNTQTTRIQREGSKWLGGILAAALCISAPAARAASGTWTNDASSIWSDSTNWLNGTVADGIDSTADFSTIDITTNRAVTLDSSRTLGNLNFADTTGASSWLLNGTSGSVLTLATSSGTPTITTSTNGANSSVAAISVPIAGTGFTKAGSGTLTIAGSNVYSGTATVSGGTLQLTNSSIAFSNAPVLYFSFDNLVGNTVINQGTGGSAMNGFLVGTNGAIVPGGRYGNALSAGTTLNNAYVFINNPVLLLNNNAAGAWTVAMWMKSSTPGGVLLYQGSGGWASGNTQFHLVGTNNNTAGPFFGGVRNSQAWESGQTNQVTDGNWHFVVMTTAPGNVKTIYVDGFVDSFPNVANQNGWNAAATGNQIWIGGTPDTGDLNAPLNGLIDEVYIYNRALSQSEIQALMNTSAGPTATVPLPANTAVSVAAPAKLDLNGNSPQLSSVTGLGTVDTTAAGSVLTINTAGSNVQFDGTITNSTSTLNLTKIGNGTLSLTGTNGYTGLTTVSGGTLAVPTTGIINIAGASGVGSLIVGNVLNNNAVLNVAGGTVNVGAAATVVGQTPGSLGFVNMTSGKFTSTSGTTQRDIDVGVGAGSYGAFRLSGGAVTLNGFLVGGITGLNSIGIWNISGGSVNVVNNFAGTLGATAGTFGMMNVTGTGNYTSTNNTSGGGAGLYVGENGTGFLNVSGSGTLNLGGVANGSRGLAIGVGNSTAVSGIVNLGAVGAGGGTITTIRVVKNGASALGMLNFHGGTLKASTTPNTTFMTGLTAAFVYGEGAIIDDSGQALTIGQQLLAPAGFGISSIPVTSGGAGYLDTPLVIISGGNGFGATAIAQVDYSTGGATSGQVTNILITNPGSGYVNGDSINVALNGGGGSGATVGTPTFVANACGGLTKLGSGSIALTGGYTLTNDLAIQGGSLSLSSATVTPASAGSLIINNAALSLDVSGGTSFAARNLNFQTSATLSIAYGTVFANPSFAAVNASGSLTAAPTNIINITGFGLRPGTFTIIKYGTGTLSGTDFANFGLSLPPGVTGTLVNNTGNRSIDLNITSSPNQLTWSGVGGVNWDLSTFNWTNNANGFPAVYQQYTNGSVIAGDGVRFDDTLTNDFVNPQPTNVNITATFTPFPVTVDSTLPYSISGPGGITGIGNFVKNNTGSLTLLTSNSFSGGMAINGGTVQVTNDSALGTAAGTVALNSGALQINGNTTNNSRVLTVAGASTVGVSNNLVARLGGTVTGGGTLTKTDLGSLTLAGNSTMTGALTVSQGTLTTLGTDTLPGVVTVGNIGGQDATLSVGGGTFNAVNNGGQFVSGLVAGSSGSASGDIRLTAGTLTVFQQLGLGGGAGGYGALNMSGGTLISGSYIVVGFNGDNAVFTQSGGATTITTNLMTIAAGGTASVGVANLSGGTFTSTDGTNGNNGGRGGIFIGENGVGTLNVSGTAAVTATGQANLTMGRTGAASAGTVNLLGGTVNTLQVSRGAGSATLNFNGGVLKATAANTAFVNGLTAANVYNGGAIIDDGGFNLTIPQALQAPGGFGVATIPITAGGSGYIDTPIVAISGGSGSNALATATVSGGVVTAIIITSPGSGYLNGDLLNVTFTGGGANAVAPTLGTPTFVANGTGGLTKRGTGTLSLSGVNTFTGPITNSAGTLTLNSASTYAGALVVNAGSVVANTSPIFNGPAIVTNGATLTITQVGSATNKMSDLTLIGGGAVPGAIVGLGLTGQNPTKALINCGVLTVNGTNTLSLSGAMSVGAIPLIKYSSMTGSGTLTNLTLPQGVVGTLSNSVSDSIIYAVITSTGPGLVWTGTNSGVGLTNLWDIASTTNWLIGATATTYRQPIIPGDAVTFNDSGSGTVILNTNAGPSSVTISNNALTYNIGGRGNLTGSGGLIKLGTGTAVLSLTNDNYSGDTTISNGTLQVGTTTALPGTANLNIGPSGTLELAGLSQSANNLFGQGTVDNNTSTNVALTLNNGGVWNGIIHDSGAGGGVSLTKVGNGTLVIGGSNYMTSPTASQVNAGLTVITNGGSVTCANSEYWVGAVGGLTATNIVDGGTITTMNNFLVVGRGSATANGTLIVNSGTVQKSGANVIVVGSLGATGTLIVNGGQVLNNSELWLGENATAVASLYLNGGLLQATDIRANGTFPTVQPAAYFNGGTLQATANSADFLQVNSYIMTNGLVFDDNGFTDTIALVPLVFGDSGNGGLVKKGAGTLYLDNFNTYTGVTLVTNGLLAGVGGVAGNVVVAPNGNLGAGNASQMTPFSIGGSLNIQGKATMRVNKTGGGTAYDQITGYTSVHFGGILVVTNATSDSTPITTSDTFQIFNTGGTGNFSSIQGSPGPGLAYSFNPANGKLSVVTAAPAITGLAFTGVPVISGTSLTISGTNAGSGSVYLLTSTNVASPLNTWLPIWTNVFTGDSSFTTNVPNAVDPTKGKQFYILGNTHN